MRTILHVDMDCFYAAVEELDNPSLKGKPVVVGAQPGQRGVVSAANYAVRKFGVHSAMPISEAYKRCPQAVFLPVRMSRYCELSGQVMEILKRFAPEVEVVSVDEAFLDITGTERVHGTALVVAKRIKAEIRADLKLTASIGIAATKFTAKIASDLRKPDGLVEVLPGTEREFLADLPVKKMWGVGEKSAAVLARIGIHTIGDILTVGRETISRHLGPAAAEHFCGLAAGDDPRRLETSREAKSISHETTFEDDIADRDLICTTLLDLADQVSFRLRGDGVRGRTVTLKIRLAPFRTYTRSRTLPWHTNLTREIFGVAWELYSKEDWAGKVRLLGVAVTGFTGPDESPPEQLDLFQAPAAPAAEKEHRAAGAVDSIRKKFGQDMIKPGRIVRKE
jgi:DNA polymerase-4